MAAPKGNQFWKLRSEHGREKLFTSPKLLWEATCEYFEWREKNPHKTAQHLGNGKKVYIPSTMPFSFKELCLYLDANSKYFIHFESALNNKKMQSEAEGSGINWTDEDEDFANIVTRIRDIIESQQWSGATIGIFKENIIARSLGLADKTKNEAAPTIVHNTVSLTPDEMREYDRALEEEYVKRK